MPRISRTKRPSAYRPPRFTTSSIASRLRLPPSWCASHPHWLPGYATKVLDGNHLSATEHRLKALRSTWAAPLPGQALVVLDQHRMLITDVFLSEDGHAQERSIIDAVLQTVHSGELWIE